MKKPTQTFNLKGNHFYKVLKGATAIVRLGDKTPELREAVLCCSNVEPYQIPITIESVHVIHFETINPFEVQRTGFYSAEELRQELQKFYGVDIGDRDVIRLVNFFVSREITCPICKTETIGNIESRELCGNVRTIHLPCTKCGYTIKGEISDETTNQ